MNTSNNPAFSLSYIISPRFRKLQNRIKNGENDPDLIKERDALADSLNKVLRIALQDEGFRTTYGLIKTTQLTAAQIPC